MQLTILKNLHQCQWFTLVFIPLTVVCVYMHVWVCVCVLFLLFILCMQVCYKQIYWYLNPTDRKVNLLFNSVMHIHIVKPGCYSCICRDVFSLLPGSFIVHLLMSIVLHIDNPDTVFIMWMLSFKNPSQIQRADWYSKAVLAMGQHSLGSFVC